MKNKKILFLALFTVFFTILYLIFAAKPLGKEYHYEPEWEINISNPPVQLSENPSLYFKLSNKIGYFDEDGKITRFITYTPEFKTSVSSDYYALYKADAQNTEFFDKNGDSKGFIKSAGFPYFSGKNIFVFLPGGASFEKCFEDGSTKWTYNGLMPITAFSAKENFTCIGT
ncbi:MAG: hypothetical protein HUK25_10670, partial [Treponema sp.]|nr:hypothetical protein [Treponema sp.]